jgi:predicted nucleic acid-binding protein
MKLLIEKFLSSATLEVRFMPKIDLALASRIARAFLAEVKRRGSSGLIAPALIRIEVAGAVLRAFRENRLSKERAKAALGEWAQMLANVIVQLIANEELYPMAVDISFRTSHPLQDCLYLAAARGAKASLITADRSLQRRGARMATSPCWMGCSMREKGRNRHA